MRTFFTVIKGTPSARRAVPALADSVQDRDALREFVRRREGHRQELRGSGGCRQCGVAVYPHRFRHHFSHTWLDRGGAEGDLMELNGWTSPQMLRRYGASARSTRARRSYDRIMDPIP